MMLPWRPYVHKAIEARSQDMDRDMRSVHISGMSRRNGPTGMPVEQGETTNLCRITATQ